MRNKKMFYSSLRYGFMLIALMCLTSFYACLGKDEPKQPKDNEKEYWQGTIDDISNHEQGVFVILSKEASLDFEKIYSVEDFPEIRCIGGVDLTWSVMEQFERQLKAEVADNWSEFQRYIDSGKLVNAEKFRRALFLRIGPRVGELPTTRNIYNAIKHLEMREDIAYAGPGSDRFGRMFARGSDSESMKFTVSGSFEGLSKETERQIRQTFLDKLKNSFVIYEFTSQLTIDWFNSLSVDDMGFFQYLGTYNGYIALGSDHSYEARLGNSVIADKLFLWTNMVGNIELWKDGQIYGLQEIYDLGYLTPKDVGNIAYFNNSYREVNLKNHPGLLGQIRGAIIGNYYEAHLRPSVPQAVFSDVQIEKYYGSYTYIDSFDILGANNNLELHIPSSKSGGRFFNDCVAIMISTKYDNYDNVSWEETAAGTLFRYNNGNKILIWKSEENLDPEQFALVDSFRVYPFRGSVPGNFYTLQEAYDLGFLKKEDIESISYYHESNKWISYIIE